MTKSIRVENADNSNHKVVVETWQGDKLVRTENIDHPTQMLTATIWKDGQHLIIKEV